MIFSKPIANSPTTSSYAYSDVRPHHLLALYSSYHLLASTPLAAKLQARLSSFFTVLLSKLSDACLPLLYSPLSALLIPDALIRLAIRARCSHTLLELERAGAEADQVQKMEVVGGLKAMPIAVATREANEQHYEVPAKFYDLCLGRNKKYSSGLWPFPSTKRGIGRGMTLKQSLDASEEAMLDLYLQRAQIEDGMRVVDLGCGWGSLTLWIAAKFPNCKITSVSNSRSQREYILKTAGERGYNVGNIEVITCDVGRWDDDEYCREKVGHVKDNDRVVSIEMFEHMKNYSVLLSKLHAFLKPTGKLFVHIFTHTRHAYHFQDGWMADTFFTGGTMPSDDLLLYFAENFSIAAHWRVDGTHYGKTSEAWLAMTDEAWRRGELKPVLEGAYGEGRGYEWYVNWRLFYLACAELFGYRGGEEWIVSHYLFERR